MARVGLSMTVAARPRPRMTAPLAARPSFSRMSSATEPAHTGNFLRHIIERDLAQGTYATRHLAGTPGDAAHHAAGPLDPAKIRTRFPPEPNGYLHIGHAKSICLNFGLARGLRRRLPPALRRHQSREGRAGVRRRHPRLRALARLRLAPAEPALRGEQRPALYFASDYFDFMYRAAEALVEAGHAYVDEQSADEMRATRGDFATPGTDSPYRDRTPAREPDALRAPCATASSPTAPRCCARRSTWRARTSTCATRRSTASSGATHHNTGDKWCIYPMYTYAHPIEDALENITHSHLHAGVRGPAALLRLAAGAALRTAACSRSRCRTSTSSRGSTSPT